MHTVVEQLCDALDASERRSEHITRAATLIANHAMMVKAIAERIEQERDTYAAELLVTERERDESRARNDDNSACFVSLRTYLQIGMRLARTEEAQAIDQDWSGNPAIQYRARCQAFDDVLEILDDMLSATTPREDGEA